MYKYDKENESIYNEETGEQFYDVYGDEISVNQNGDIIGGLSVSDLRPVDWDGIDYYTPQGRQDLTKIERFFGNDLTNDQNGRGWHIFSVKDKENAENVRNYRIQCVHEFYGNIFDAIKDEDHCHYVCYFIEDEIEYKPDREKLLDGEYNTWLTKKKENEKNRKKLINKWISIFSVLDYEMVNILKYYKNGDISFDEFEDLMHPDGNLGKCYT